MAVYLKRMRFRRIWTRFVLNRLVLNEIIMAIKLKKSGLHIINVALVGTVLFLVILLFLFVGYVYALQYNATLYIPGFSERANKVITAVWKTPFVYPTPTPLMNESSVLYGAPKVAPEFTGITKWYNSEPVTIRQYKGRKIVVLVFGRLYCTYCQNVYTYLTEWQRNYGSDHIQVIGIQSPKYDGEKVWDDVVKEIKERDVNFPVGFDENRQTMTAYEIDMVPNVLVIDKEGIIRYSHLGEGGFAETEKAIKEVIRMEYPNYK